MMTSLRSLIWILAVLIIMTKSALIIHRKPLFPIDNSARLGIPATPISLEDYLPRFSQWIRAFEKVNEDLEKETMKNQFENIGKQSPPEILRRRKILVSLLRLK